MRTITALTLTRPTDTRQSEPDPGELWKDRALCRTWDFEKQADPWFEPIPGKTGRDRWRPEVRAICDECPVRAMCARDALTAEAAIGGPRYGFVGGLTPEERASLALLGRLA
jgi:hypothetical protein